MKSNNASRTEKSKRKKEKFIQESKRIIDATLQKLANQLELGISDEMKRYLKTMSLFPNYSIGNQQLIISQKPNASHVCGYHVWKQLNRFVRKGEKGIRILAPLKIPREKNKIIEDENREERDSNQDIQLDKKFLSGFRIVRVFDLSQTGGENLPQSSIARGDAKAILPLLERAVSANRIQFKYGYMGRALGMTYNDRIIIRPGMPPAETFSTLVHEFAHVILHQVNSTEKETKTVEELEADSAACVVCERFGLNAIQASADYIQIWNGDKRILLQRLDRIRSCASQIIQAIEKETRIEADSKSQTYSQSIYISARND